jgi:hypothetical protein
MNKTRYGRRNAVSPLSTLSRIGRDVLHRPRRVNGLRFGERTALGTAQPSAQLIERDAAQALDCQSGDELVPLNSTMDGGSRNIF